mmetsp:Transcript_80515/g.127167  ORF Transcript_80515/g.127167 Transcript_80515/m.127167 type:complete len:207 (-) Transcript_80515:2-622(-)
MKHAWLFFLGFGLGHGVWVTYDQLQGEAPVVHQAVKKRRQRHQALQASPEELQVSAAQVSASRRSRQIDGAESNASGELGIASQLDDAMLQKFGLNKSSFQAIVLKQQQNGDPNVPPVEPSPAQLRAVTSSDRGFNILKKAYEFVRPFRARGEDMVASLLMIGDAENCLMKLAYSTYRMDRDGEDDYPYLPRKCGDDFRWDTGTYF